MQNDWIKFLFVIVFLSTFGMTPVMAQEQQGAMDGKVDYSNEELKSFIIANAGIYQVQQQVSAHLQSAESDQDKQQLMQTANRQMEEVVEQAGLTTDQYNAMGQAIQADTQLQEKVNTIASDLFQQEAQQ